MTNPIARPWREIFCTTPPEFFEEYIKEGGNNLNFGCAGRLVGGWYNYDPNIHNVEGVTPHLPNWPDYFDTIVAWHSLEHIEGWRNLLQTVCKIHTILKPGGHFIAVCPHAQSTLAVGPPMHVQLFNELTWAYFTKKPFAVPGTMGHMAEEGEPVPDWELVKVGNFLMPNVTEEQTVMANYLWNVIQDTAAIFKK